MSDQQVLSAKPDGYFTYNATVTQKDGTDSEVAKLQYHRFKEEGSISLTQSAQTYKIIHATSSGIWHLQLDQDDTNNEIQPLIVATKPRWYRNSVIFEMEGQTYEMVRPSLRKRDYEVGRVPKEEAEEPSSSDQTENEPKKEKVKPYILRGPKVGQLLTDGASKRTYTITFDQDVRLELLLFCYWVVSLFNKRSNQSSGGGGGGGGGGC